MIRTLEDITGADAVVPITNDKSLQASGWVQIASQGGTTRVGDTDVSESRGIPVLDGLGMFLPPLGLGGLQDTYVLADINLYVPAGVIVSVTYWE